ncbi:MAG: RnfABCDGE type electron transport complex subunit D, partial [Arenimonas sp.]
VLWLPALHGWRLGLALLVAIVLARQAFGGLGKYPFHPAMAGAAFAQFAFGAAPATVQGPGWLALAWLLGGLALCALRIARWQAPLGLFAGALLASACSGRTPMELASAPWVLAAFFILVEPTSGCESRPARWLFAVTVGALTVLASPPGQLAALPFALLAMNALAPALDRWLEPRARAVAP